MLPIPHNINKIKRVFVYGRLCFASITDSNLIKKYLAINGLLTNSIKRADAIIINTCGYSHVAERDSLKKIEYINKRKKRSAMVIIHGCLPVINKGRLAKYSGCETIHPMALDKLDRLLPVKIKISEVKYSGTKEFQQKNKDMLYKLRVGWGCYGRCSYCAIKNVFGRPRSRPIGEIIDEFKMALSKGYENILLVANELGCYGADIKLTIMDLIDEIMKVKGAYKIRLLNFAPQDVILWLPRLKKYIKQKKITYMYIACQSGSDKILKLMGRGYTVGLFKDCIVKLRKISSTLELKTDMIVGFPQESENDFRATIDVIRWLRDHNVSIQAVPFSPRPRTKAIKMEGKLDKKTIQRRLRIVHHMMGIQSFNV